MNAHSQPLIPSASPMSKPQRKRRVANKSTATEDQYDRLLAMLRTGPKNTFELRDAGLCAPAARVKELNDCFDAYIPTIDLIDVTDSHGYFHKRVAVYELIDEPNFVREGVVQ